MRIKSNVAISASGLIFNPETGESFTVNPMGAEIINFLKQGDDREAVAAKIIDRYNIDKTSFEKDFEDFTALLQNYLLIEDE